MNDAQQPSVAVGAVFQGRYEILAELGEGGFGTVYKGTQLATGQPVAIKVLRLSDDRRPAVRAKRLARFQREMQLCAHLHHPNVVRLIDSGQTDDGLVYSVFEFAPGRNLGEVLNDEGRLNPFEAKHLMLQILDGLACAHAQGVVHRDLKPANVMVIPTGARRNALILDFGIGALTEDAQGDDHARITSTNESLGTPSYAAPEQLRGLPPTPRSDLYAWGLVFLECLTGQRAVGGDSVGDVISRQLGPEPVSMPAALAEHPLGRILQQAMVKDPDARLGTAESLLRELEACDVSALVARGGPVTHVQPAESNAETSTVDRTGKPGSGEGGPWSRPPSTPGRRLASGERRQLTAVCCAFTAPGASVDAAELEEIDEMLRDEQEACAEIARRFEGHVAGALGDQVLFYFGYPAAREDDAQRAARAALEMVASTRSREGGEGGKKAQVEIRVGIHTGLVVARDLGEMTAGGLGHVVGTTPKMAARMSALAQPGGITVSRETAKLLRDRFALDEEAEQRLDGDTGPIEVFRLRVGPPGEAGMTTLGGRATPMVGRAREMEILLERWGRLRGGSGQSVLVTGEPGIGKSRLVRELSRRVRGEAHTWLECRCAPDSMNSALYPIVDLLVRTLDLGVEPTPEGKAGKLTAFLSRYGFDLADAMPLFSPLLSLPLGPSYKPAAVSPQKQKEQTFAAILSLFFEMAEQRPVVLAAEDLHWADPTSLELFKLLVGEVPSARVFAMFSARPEFVPAWSTTSVFQIQLGRLDRPQIDAMAAKVTGGRALPAEVLEQIAARTDGVPLFVEELIRMMVESGVLREEGERYALVGPLSSQAIPTTLRDSLMARLDRLGRAKETAQVAAALGREFSFDVLSAASTLGHSLIQEDLDKLVAAELVYRKRRLRNPTYTFKHALIRDTAYESMLKRARLEVHARIARTLEERFPEIVRERPELLALHLAAADRKAQAIKYAEQAAGGALQRSANAEAVGYARQALGWLDAIAGERARAEAELGLNGIITPALMATRGWTDPELKATVDRSRALLDVVGNSPHSIPTLWALITYHHMQGQRREARGLAERLLVLSEALGANQLVASLPTLGHCLIADGSLETAKAVLLRAVSLYDFEKHRGHALVYGLDSKAYADMGLSLGLWLMGFPDQAFARATAAAAWARELNHVSSLALGLNYVSMAHQLRGERDELVRTADSVIELANRHGLPAHATYSGILRCWATRDVEGLKQNLGILEMLGFELGLSYYRALVPELEAEAGKHGEALARVEQILARARETGETYWIPDLLRMAGVLTLEVDPRAGEAALERLHEAIAVAREQGAAMLELRATTSLARVLRKQGRTAEAREALHAILARVTEGSSLPELREARAALEG
jgi:TOMM system kinase/cyclase fusion protein